MQTAISHWEQNTSLKFVPKTSSTRNYILFYNGDGNFSQLGMTGGEQKISLKTDNFNEGSAIHEIGHAIGLFHEQCRSDRDNYITINWNNIEKGKEYNFQTFIATGEAGANIGPFDFGSIMLYGSNSFSTSLPTIVKKNGEEFVGQRKNLSSGDIAGVKAMYGPPFPKITSTRTVIQDYFDQFYEKWEYEDKYYIEFYTDETYTKKAALTYPRRIRATKSTTSFGVNESRDAQEYTIPANTNSFYLGTGYVRGWYEYSVCKDNYSEIYFLD